MGNFYRLKLAADGVPAVLTEIQSDDRLKRQFFDRAIAHIASTVIAAVESGIVDVSLCEYCGKGRLWGYRHVNYL